MSTQTATTVKRGGAGAGAAAAAAGHKAPTLVLHENYKPADTTQGRGKGFPAIFQADPKAKQYTWEEVAQHNTGECATKRSTAAHAALARRPSAARPATSLHWDRHRCESGACWCATKRLRMAAFVFVQVWLDR